ncbi:MAG: UvrD-helicase domain-containing protein [Ardenticatenales bacterium]|nr:UvrD-helicase domain-containing protein [Ardenticatenales bacterium]
MAELLAELNPQQRQAVETIHGPLLVLAGPGSGKTKVLTHRIAYIIQQGIDPWNILAVTFTNKASKEMRHHLDGLVGAQAREVMMGTFHSLCARILRHHAQHVGYDRSFIIYDTEDQRRLIKQVLAEMNLSDKSYKPAAVHGVISRAKNDGLGPTQFRPDSYWEEVVGRIYEQYQDKLQRNNALDFDDLLLLTARLLRETPAVLDSYRRRWQYILVDEFQDTNLVQYELIRLLAEGHKNIFVVGDMDQCVPAGSLVLTPRGELPIEQIREGDTVISGAGRGTTTQAIVQKVHQRSYAGKIIRVTLQSGNILRVTPNHMCFARLGVCKDVHYVYLMYREDKGYRLGICVGARSDGRTLMNGLQVRVNQEHADRMWILRVCPTRNEATYYEQYYAFEYGIPTTIFHIAGRGELQLTQENINQLYASIDTRTRAAKLMEDLGLYVEYPHYRAQVVGSIDHSHRMVVHLTAFGGNGPSLQSPWYRHRVWLNTKDRILEQQVIHGGIETRPGSRGTWRVERIYKEFERTLLLAEQIAKAAGGAEIVRWATFTKGDKFAFTPAAHLRPTMVVPRWEDGQIVDDEIIAVEDRDYSGPIYDLDVVDLHNYIVEGIVVHNSVYGWRGADYRNILKFEETFPEAKTIALEQNYRSTQTILDAASALIRRNRQRKDKGLWSDLGPGNPIILFEAYDEREEAQFITREIQRLKRRDGYDNRDFAILYRMNAQSRALEEAFVRSSMKYVIVGGTRFYERREVKDVLAYLRLLHNPSDSVSLERIINVPTRGIGDKSVEQLIRWAGEMGMSAFRALETLEKGDSKKEELSTLLPQVPPPFSGRIQSALLGFYRIMQPILESLETMNLPMLVGEVVQRTQYEAYLRDGSPEGEEHWSNVIELQNVAAQYENLETREALAEFLENVALVSDADNVPDNEFDSVTLMTLHTAKGLEYPVVFIPGLDENVLPHSRAQENQEEMEEERRLAYVGVTRAKQRLYLIHTFRRTTWGRSEVSSPSRFLGELPKEAWERSTERSMRPAGEQRATSERSPARTPQASRKRTDVEESPSPWSTRRVEPEKSERAKAKPGATTTFKAGDQVRHAKFGVGIVLSCTPAGADEEVTVAFPGDTPKKLLASFAHLEKVS